MTSKLKKVFELINPEINSSRFIAVQTQRGTVNVIDLAVIDNIEIDVDSKLIWLGKENYINFRDLLYSDTIEVFYAKLVKHWIDYKLDV